MLEQDVQLENHQKQASSALSKLPFQMVSLTNASSRAEGLLFLHGLESNPGSSLQTEEEAGLP